MAMFTKPGQDPQPAPPTGGRPPEPQASAPAPASPPPASSYAPAASTASSANRMAGRGDTPNSVLGPDLAIRGGIEGRGDIHLQGRAWGDVKVEGLLVGEAAELEGSVIANVVEVRGRVTGSITANSVRLLPSARVDGDITYEVLQIEAGATFEGRCIKAKTKAAPRAEASSAPAGAKSPEPTAA